MTIDGETGIDFLSLSPSLFLTDENNIRVGDR